MVQVVVVREEVIYEAKSFEEALAWLNIEIAENPDLKDSLVKIISEN